MTLSQRHYFQLLHIPYKKKLDLTALATSTEQLCSWKSFQCTSVVHKDENFLNVLRELKFEIMIMINFFQKMSYVRPSDTGQAESCR